MDSSTSSAKRVFRRSCSPLESILSFASLYSEISFESMLCLFLMIEVSDDHSFERLSVRSYFVWQNVVAKVAPIRN
jgi:hypothetical protein